jgi:hypothetical protein
MLAVSRRPPSHHVDGARLERPGGELGGELVFTDPHTRQQPGPLTGQDGRIPGRAMKRVHRVLSPSEADPAPASVGLAD